MIPFDQAAGIATICILAGGTLGWWLHAAMPARKQPIWLYVGCPLAETEDEALDWFEKRGGTDIKLWRGLDGLVRGTGKVPDGR